MAKIFFPERSVFIDASSPPHPTNTRYKISIGKEDWGNGEFTSVVKVQMEYNKVVAGRRSPSYPLGTDDYERVNEAIQKLLNEN